MLATTLVSIVFGASTTLGALRSNNVNTRYFVGPFNGGEFSMAVDTCLPFSVLGQDYQMATCDSETQVTWVQYDDDECTTPLITQVTNSTLTQTGMGNYFDFNCNEDYTDAYTEVEFSLGDCETQTKVTMAAALDTCVANTGLFGIDPNHDGDLSDVDSLLIYCDSTVAELQYFSSPGSLKGDCNETNFYQKRNATTTCDYMLTVGTNDVYGKLIECTEDPVPTVIDMDDSASRLSIMAVVIVSVYAALSM